tara:strand:- start:517 stop:1515 length:999 start_codon:yes stop_codon:yes gene_type:complete
MNILLTCAGRRSYLIEYFKELSDVNEVHTANSIIDSPAMLVSDYIFHTESIYSEDYVNSIITYCKKNNIKMVISLLDLELTILSKKKDLFKKNNIFLAISNYNVCKLCNDKYLTQKFLIDNKFSTVNLYLSPSDVIEAVNLKEACYPFFIKPRWGMGSISVYQADDEEELLVLCKKVKKELQKSYLNEDSKAFNGDDIIIQEALKGEEYGLDVLNDFNGNFIKTFVKKKVAMRSGETDSAITISDKYLEKLGEEVSKKLMHYGNLDVDVFYDGKQAYILEFNPRFGGGYPFTHLAGANIAKAYVDMYIGNTLKFNFASNIKASKMIIINKSN